MKKKFVVTWQHNYGDGSAIIYADDEEQARKMCDTSNHIWDGYDLEPIEEREESTIIFLT